MSQLSLHALETTTRYVEWSCDNIVSQTTAQRDEIRKQKCACLPEFFNSRVLQYKTSFSVFHYITFQSDRAYYEDCAVVFAVLWLSGKDWGSPFLSGTSPAEIGKRRKTIVLETYSLIIGVFLIHHLIDKIFSGIMTRVTVDNRSFRCLKCYFMYFYRLMSGVWCLVSGVWCLMSDAWCLISDIWYLVSDVWYLMSDIWCLVSGVWW